MTEWKECKLGDVIRSNNQNITNGYSYKTIQYLDTGSITEGQIDGFQEYNLSDAPSRAKRLVKNNDIIYSTVRPIQRHYGFIIEPPENLVVSTGFSVIETNNTLAEPLFVYYFLISDEIVETLDVIADGSTSAYPSLKPSDIEYLDIILPPLPEQSAIASVLSSLDDKIDLLHRQNKTLEAMAETLFRQWFVEEAKENWEVVKLDSLINISSGKGLKKEHLSENGAYPVLGANGEIGRTNEFLFNESLLFTGRVGTLGNIFRVENERVWLSDNTLVIKPKNYFNFIYFVLKTAKLEEYNVGSTQPLIRQSDIKEIEINLPSENKLHEFEKESDLLLNKIRQNKSQVRTIEKLRDTLLPKLMSGEVRVQYDKEATI